MRKRFIELLSTKAKSDSRPFLVVGDLGYGVVESFAKAYPDRYLNIGVAEQAGLGLSAGLARDYLPFFYSIGNFCIYHLPMNILMRKFLIIKKLQ